MRTSRPFAPSALALRGHAEALLMVAASTVVGLLIAARLGDGAVVLLYLPAVLGAAVACGRWPALVAALCSALAYNYWFIAPYRTLLIHSPADVVTVAVLFLVALVTSQLAGSMREKALLADAHARRNATIAGLARRLLSCADEAGIARVAAGELAGLLGCNVVVVSGREEPAVLASWPEGMALSPGDRAAAALTLESGDPAGRGLRCLTLADWQFHAIAVNGAVVAAIGLARDDGRPPVGEDQLPLLGNLLDQVALALERARLEEEARDFAATRQRDVIRAALLTSIGRDIRPRLDAILAAAGALRRSNTADRPLAATVAAQAARLDRYIANLLDLGPLSDEPPIALGSVVIDLFHRGVTRDGVPVHLTPKEFALLAELAKHAGRVLSHAQLLRSVWGPAQEDHVDYLRVAIRALRQKLEENPARPRLIVNEPAVGYRLVLPG
ncbi:DUF4118 domain-containing protein [Novosphingobium bradum]|uniref:DUF4118 domain-containing protein n=1 Tax=Novosphingobium bradum TaxID=1737444 RepID=A0ABV7IY00_9SPHN